MYSIGKAPDLAASKLQNSIRRFLFRCKIRKYLAYYNKILTERSEKIFSVIKKHIRCYAAKQKIENIKFLLYRKRRLHEIRRNLAILSVKKHYRELKLTFKVFKHRISKYKRKIKNS